MWPDDNPVTAIRFPFNRTSAVSLYVCGLRGHSNFAGNHVSPPRPTIPFGVERLQPTTRLVMMRIVLDDDSTTILSLT